jgi:methylmalonyl-CoA/ethylmalonyl-CoA epimerase
MILDHVGIAVRSIEKSATLWESVFGYRPVSPVVENHLEHVRVLLLAKAGSLPIKLIEPTGASSPAQALALRGGGLHHLCFRCESLDAEVTRLQAMGMRLLAPPQPGAAFEDARIAFFHVGDGLVLELLEVRGPAGVVPADP